MRALPLLAAAILLVRCSGSTAGLPLQTHADAHGGATVTMRYLGTGGWSVARGDEAFLTAPLFTNPSVLRVGLLPLRPNRAVILEQMQRASEREHVRFVLAGHAHYDHILDLPVVFEMLPANARLYSGSTTKDLLNEALGGRAESVLGDAGTWSQRGKWTKVGGIRFMPIVSEHAAHYRGVKLYSGHSDRAWSEPPRRATDWNEGETLAFLIDFLDGERPVFRIYYNDTAHGEPYGLPDPATLEERDVDVAILTVASFAQVSKYPEWILKALQPKHVVLSHWEDFFTPVTRPERTVRFTDVHQFVRNLPAGTQFTMLRRQGTVTFTPGSSPRAATSR